MGSCADSWYPRHEPDRFDALMAGQHAMVRQPGRAGVTAGIEATLRALSKKTDLESTRLHRTLELLCVLPAVSQSLIYEQTAALLAMREIERLNRAREIARFYFAQTCQQNHCVIKPRRRPGATSGFHVSLMDSFRLYHRGWRNARAECRTLEEAINNQIMALGRSSGFLEQRMPLPTPKIKMALGVAFLERLIDAIM